MNDLEISGPLEGIAVIGMAGRFPKARNLAEFWRNLRDGVESTSFFGDEELREAGIEPEIWQQSGYVKARAILEDAEWFDASFFGLSGRESEIIDPQHRLFLECAWETMEDAGYEPAQIAGLVGVFGGASMNTYLLNNLASNPELLQIVGDYQTMLGNDKDFLTTRVSYKLGLTGPSITVQTACSTSLVAVVLACQSLLSYQCDMALAGGVSVMFPQKKGHFYREGGIHSPDGRCRAFDEAAQGMFAGQGVGMVALKRLQEAISDGDHIYAVIKGAAINNDGSQKVGYTAPSVEGQAEVISLAHALAEVEPETISYVEAHGTATPLGDVVEIAGLTQAFDGGKNGSRTQFCAIGSVKTNIGHLDAAAGVAGLIKTVLALQNKLLPPSLHYVRSNPRIDFANSPFYVNRTLAEWKQSNTPRRAGVSSFGIGGTNAHVVLEEAQGEHASRGQSAPSPRRWQLLNLSARSQSALQTATENLVAHLRQQPQLNLADVAYTLHVGRRHFAYRRIALCSDVDDALNVLENRLPDRLFNGRYDPADGDAPVVFLFSGQGAQYVAMGQELYESEAVFREQVDACCDFLVSHLGLDLREVLYPGAGADTSVESAAERLQQTNLTQPALFVIEYALAQLWISWGIRPQALIGHSIGEYVAACLAGVFSLEDALRLVAVRGALMQTLPPGAMLVVHQSEEALRPWLNGQLSLAAINGPSLCVISGPEEAIDALAAELSQRAVDCRRLHTSHAFHSEMMAPAVEPFAAEVARVSLHPPRIPFVSNVSGSWISAEEATNPRYWAAHLRQTVRFAQGLSVLLARSQGILLEVGPGHTLSTLARQHPDRSGQQLILSSMRHAQEKGSDVAFLMTTLGRLWLGGAAVDWRAYYSGERRQRTSLPTYPFERQRYWVEPRRRLAATAVPAGALAKRTDPADWFYVPAWQSVGADAGEASAPAKQKRRWLVFGSEHRFSRRLVQRLRRMGQQVIEVEGADVFAQTAKWTYTLDPRRAGDYQALMDTLWQAQQVPDAIVHLWGVGEDEDGGLAALDRLAAALDVGFYSLLFLAKALGRRQINTPLPIQIVTTGLQSVTGEEKLRPEKATVLGPCRVITLEHPNLSCRSVDVILPSPGSGEEDVLLDQLLAEAVTPSPEPVVAYRGGARWLPSYEPARLAGQDRPNLREEGVYLITGGLGGVGLVLAEFLARAVRAKLVLVGRSALPPRAEWERWLTTHDAEDHMSRQIRGVQRLEALGAETMIISADVTNRQEMAEVIDQSKQRFGAIHGVIHAAGIAGGGIIQLRTAEQASAVLAPKVQGTMVLDALLPREELELFVLCSSINAVLPDFGQVDYCAANAFLNAFAHAWNRANGPTCVSINWDTWQEVGMAVNTDVPAQLRGHREENLKHGLLNSEGQEAFRRIVSNVVPEVLVSPRDWNLRQSGDLRQREVRQGLDIQGVLDSLAVSNGNAQPAATAAYHARPDLQTVYVAPRNELEHHVARIWQDLLSVEQVGIHDNFFDLGGSSLLALRLFAQIEKLLGKSLPLATLFEASTVAELCAMLDVSQPHRTWSSLVPIQTEGTRPPIFFVHAAGGNILIYRDLARHLGPEQPVYGLQTRGMNGEQPLLTGIEEMADAYVEEVLALQAEGPYLLGGYCMGGSVALEMAHKLQQRGKEVALLALLETYNWGQMPHTSLPSFAYFFLQKIGFHWRNFLLLNRKEKSIFLEEKLKVVRGRSRVWRAMLLSRLGRGNGQQADLQLRPGEIWETNDRAALNYRPAPYQGEITHLCPIREYARYSGPELRWDSLAAQVTSHKLPVYPGGMLVEPFVSETARVLRQHIESNMTLETSPDADAMELTEYASTS